MKMESLSSTEKDGQIVDVRPYYEESKETEEVEKKEAKPKIMIRIVDVRRMLMSLKLKSLMAVSFQITDPLIPEITVTLQ